MKRANDSVFFWVDGAERRSVLDSADTIAACAKEMSEFLKTSELTETRAFVRAFVKEVVVKPGRAAILYSLPSPHACSANGSYRHGSNPSVAITLRLELLANPAGMHPVISFPLRSRARRFVREPSSVGMLPLRLFPWR